jgi:hydrogenase/urease accessory protein HupE
MIPFTNIVEPMKAARSSNVERWTLNVERFLRRAIRCLTFFLLGLILLPSWSGVAYAHPVAQGRLEIDIFPDKIHARARVSNEEVFVQNALSSREENGRLPRDEMYRRHGDYLLQHIHFLADGKSLPGHLAHITAPGAAGLQFAIYDFEFALPAAPARLRIDEDVLNEFDYAPGNRWEATYVTRVAQQGRQPVEGLLLTSREPLMIDCDWTTVSPRGNNSARVDQWRLTKQYIRHGVMHILTGYDHLLFISALVLAVVTLWDLVKVITAFTVAHSITLSLSILNVVRLSSRIVEPMIAASIIFVALQNVFWPRRSRGAARLGIAFFFGLFHGLGFAGGLLAAMEGMAGLTVGLAIVAFSLGIELGHQIVVVPIFGGLKLIRSLRTNSVPLSEYALRYGSAVICAAGIVYLVAALR